MIYKDIMAALYTRLSLLNAEMPIVYQLKRYSPLNGGREPFIRVNLYRNKPQRLTMGEGNVSLHKGILQCTITHIPTQADWIKSEGDYLALGERLVEHFPADLTLWHGAAQVRISQIPELGAILSEPSQVTLPVSIYWQAGS